MTDTILITGANKGIGAAVVKSILGQQRDCRVLLGSRNQQRGEAAREAVLAATGANAESVEAVPLDVTDARSVNELAEKLTSAGTSLYGLVNNAGTIEGSLQQILDVNAFGVQRVCERFAPLIVDGGRIVNVTSASGPNYVARCAPQWQQFFTNQQIDWPQLQQFMQQCIDSTASELEQRGLPSDADYGLSKACANLYSMICAREISGLSVHACTPGFIETDLTREMTKGSGQSAADMGMKQPADGARVIMHLLFNDVAGTGYYFGSDAKRSPLDCYRAPGSPEYKG